MNKVAIAFLTKDHVDLSRQTVPTLLDGQHALFWIDGSVTEEGKALPLEEGYPCTEVHQDVRGGPDAAVAYALTLLLNHSVGYTHIGLCESDVLMPPDWFDRTMALFEMGARDGLKVGAASPRCYEDRILFQRDGYAVMHGLGWGVQVMTREAAALALKYMRTGYTLENRRTFCNLSSVDIGAWWAFRGGEHALCADWRNDFVLVAHGLASVALTPSPVQMIGQIPPLAEQGLKIIRQGGVEARRNDPAFLAYASATEAIREQDLRVPVSVPQHDDAGTTTYFAHQVKLLEGACYKGDWFLRFSQGFGPFAWKAGEMYLDGPDFNDYRDGVAVPDVLLPYYPTFNVMASGTCEFFVSGGEKGGRFLVEDLQSGYSVSPTLPPESPSGSVLALACPAAVSRRMVRLTALSPGVCFFGIRCREPQPERVAWAFDHSVLPRT